MPQSSTNDRIAAEQTERDYDKRSSDSSSPLTSLQRLAASSTGEVLPFYGYGLFHSVPDTFAQVEQTQVAPDYILGPGDEVLIRLWGRESSNLRLTIDRSGAIYIPRVGTVNIAGLRFNELDKVLREQLQRIYRNYDLTVTLGQLHSIPVFVVGEAERPGLYTIGALSTLVNALFASGGPSHNGSMRHILVRRNDQVVTDFDLYDLLARGDKSKDVRLQPQDVIVYTTVGPQIALAGEVRHPAIYELKSSTNVADILKVAGGLTSTASDAAISIERIEEINGQRARKAFSIPLTDSAYRTLLQDGDVLQAAPVTLGFEKSVTLRGNLSNPGRFAWHPGMHVSELIPDRRSLLTRGYWEERNRLGLPSPLFVAQSMPRTPQRKQIEHEISRSSLAEEAQAADQNPALSSNPVVDVTMPAAELDWSYAVIERTNPQTLKSTLVPFNLGRLVQDKDPSQDLVLEPGDVLTIFSQSDIHVGIDEQTKFVRLEGEFVSAGIYSVQPDETLAQLVHRTGGLTTKAYLYGSSFTRESARVTQQARLDEYISALSVDLERDASLRSVSSIPSSEAAAAATQQADLAMIAQLRQMRATGRIVMEFSPMSQGIDVIPSIPLENGDVFRISSKPVTIGVVGAVYGPNTLLYDPHRIVEDYIGLAGSPTRNADRSHAFLIRADGSVFSGNSPHQHGARFTNATVYPGDTLVVPQKPVKPSALRGVIDWSSVFSQFALGAAAINVIR